MDEQPDTPPPLPEPGATPAPPPLPGDVPAAPPPPPPPPLPSDDDAKLLHQTEDTRTYPCRQCGGELEFHIGEQQLKCPHCGHVQEIVDDDDAEVIENDFRAAVAEMRAGASTTVQVEGEKEVVCQNCGGHTTFSGSLTATRCPYCATPIQRDDVHDAPERIAVDGVLPFQVDEKTAKSAIEKWIKSRWFAPNEFKKYATTGSFASVYSAYFTYDSATTTEYRGQRGDNYTVTVGSGENRRTETRIRWRPAWGTVRNSFDDLPVLANEGLERRHMEALEPWPTQMAKPFSPEYLAGHLCRTYDHDVEECFPRAKDRMEAEIRSTVKRDIGGDHQRISSMSVRYEMLTFKHLLLPVWLLTVLYLGKPFQVFINGVTGEVQGQRPYSKVKIALAVAAAVIAAIVIYLVVQANGAEPQ